MKGLVKRERTQGLWMEDVPLPQVGNNEVLIKTRKTSICGTDVHIYKWDAWAQKTIPVPMIVGHEFMGEIAEVGKHVKGLKVGDRVCGEGHIVCGQCPNCRKGLKHICVKTLVLLNISHCLLKMFFLSLLQSEMMLQPFSILMAMLFIQLFLSISLEKMCSLQEQVR
jgi:threonine 3-dehydrogenase